jgi:hypothetical protein
LKGKRTAENSYKPKKIKEGEKENLSHTVRSHEKMKKRKRENWHGRWETPSLLCCRKHAC